MKPKMHDAVIGFATFLDSEKCCKAQADCPENEVLHQTSVRKGLILSAAARQPFAKSICAVVKTWYSI
jgi:hypothetical protein